MAAITKSVSGSVTTFVITDQEGNTLTMAVTSGAVTGNTIVFTSSGGLHYDGMAMASTLLLQLQTGLIPGAGAQGLLP